MVFHHGNEGVVACPAFLISEALGIEAGFLSIATVSKRKSDTPKL